MIRDRGIDWLLTCSAEYVQRYATKEAADAAAGDADDAEDDEDEGTAQTAA